MCARQGSRHADTHTHTRSHRVCQLEILPNLEGQQGSGFGHQEYKLSSVLPYPVPRSPPLNPWVRHQGHCDLISSYLSSSANQFSLYSLFGKYSCCSQFAYKKQRRPQKKKKWAFVIICYYFTVCICLHIYIYIFICCVLCSRINLSCKSLNAEHFTAASYRCKCATEENSPPDGMEGVSTKKKDGRGEKQFEIWSSFFFFFFSRRAPDEGRWRFKYNHVRQDTGKSQLSPNYTKEKKEKKSVSARHRDADLQAQSQRKHTLALRLIELKATCV